ncbi:MAG: insulinase family protein [bacterium]|nr:MAG: insulinase family protein [bacterium]
MKQINLGALFMVVFILACATSSRVSKETDEKNELTMNLNQILPVDPAVFKDTLDNGVIYMIRKNAKPENRAELRLVVNAGSILESDQQQGLAHFCEHMAFNGTQNFHKNELVDYLESIGMRFGPEINAYTSFDETVYMLQVPTDSSEIMKKAFQVLQDWAAHISFDSEEIEKERGVVVEEWRLGRGADARIRDKQFPILFWNSRYAERLPIGERTVLDTFHHDTLRRFYRDWYRPDLMAVVAVGDFQVEDIKKLIIENFSNLNSPSKPLTRELYPVPGHNQTLYSIASDPEARFSNVGLYYKLPVKQETTVGEYRQNLIEMLYNRMFNQRLSEISKKENPPFLFASSGKGRFVRSSEIYLLNAVVEDNEIPRGFKALVLEAKRVKKFGFTETEMERNKISTLRMMKQALDERDKTESQLFADEYIRHFLQEEPIPGIENEYAMFSELMPGISLEDINALANSWITETNRVILASYPEKEGILQLQEQQLAALIDSAENVELEPYVDDQLDLPLLQIIPQPGSIVSENYIEELGVTEMILQNGIKVILKTTDFKNDEILFTAFSPGGISLVEDSNLVAARTAVAVIREGGLGQFSQDQLQKRLAGKIVEVSPYLGELSEGISGNVSPQDLETLFQLVYLYFTEPRADSVTFVSLKNRFKAFYENRSASPESAFQDTITVTVTQNHPRYRPWSVEDLAEMNYRKSLRIYRDRFAEPGDFTCIFVGNFEKSEIISLIKTYLGGLPTISRHESWGDETYDPPNRVVKKQFYKGLEPKSQTSLIFTGDFKWTIENRFKADTFIDLLRIKLRERIREDLGGTYGVRVFGSFSRYPRERFRVTINYGADPKRIPELTEAIFEQIDSLKSTLLPESYLQKIKEISLREYESNLKENNYWLEALEFRYFHGQNPESILKINSWIEQLRLQDFQDAARIFLDESRYIQVTLYPEGP